MPPSRDHYICAAHMRRWSTDNRVTMLRRGLRPKAIDVGVSVAAEQGLNHPAIESAYAKIESAFMKALPKLLDRSTPPTDADWVAVREYVVLVHDRYPALRGSAARQEGLLGGNALMGPNPANWGTGRAELGHLARLSQFSTREELKALRLQLIHLNARLLPLIAQVFYAGPLVLGDAGVHAINLRPDPFTERTFVAMPLTPDAFVAFGNRQLTTDEARNLGSYLNMKIAAESTVLIDTVEAPLINGFISTMWSTQPAPVGTGLPSAVHIWSNPDDIPASRASERTANVEEEPNDTVDP